MLRTRLGQSDVTAGRNRVLAYKDLLTPPEPPMVFTEAMACDATTDQEILWLIARECPLLRRWLIANPRADAALLEYVAQAGGPGVKHAFEVLFEADGL